MVSAIFHLVLESKWHLYWPWLLWYITYLYLHQNFSMCHVEGSESIETCSFQSEIPDYFLRCFSYFSGVHHLVFPRIILSVSSSPRNHAWLNDFVFWNLFVHVRGGFLEMVQMKSSPFNPSFMALSSLPPSICIIASVNLWTYAFSDYFSL